MAENRPKIEPFRDLPNSRLIPKVPLGAGQAAECSRFHQITATAIRLDSNAEIVLGVPASPA